MSGNFTGVTFAKQTVLPSDDAIIRRAILPDGILTGCEMSYSGSTLTMAAGQLMICGRQIRHPSAQNWAVVEATSGYARLLLTIDLTRTATTEVFDQVEDSIEYATAKDGFPELEQTDINTSGTRYQIVACIVSLGTGGITGIVSQLEKSVAGLSGGLNFSLVGGTTQPSDPKENTIWVKTAAEITGYAFSTAAPDDAYEGMVWIRTGSSSPVALSMLKNTTIMVYPAAAKQYVGGLWVDVSAKSFIGGEWMSWIQYLFTENGGQNVPWVFRAYNANGTVSQENGSIVFSYSTVDNAYTAAGTQYAVDLSGFTKLCFDLKVTAMYSSVEGPIAVGVTSAQVVAGYQKNTFIASASCDADSVRRTVEVDITNVNSGYVSIHGLMKATVYNVWAE